MGRSSAALALLVACGDPGDAASVRDRLNALPGVSAALDDTRLAVTFELPLDHADPGAGTFPLHATLAHRDTDAPLVVLTSGYFDYYGDTPVEPTGHLGANQVSIEHRFFGASRPDLAADPARWRYLTVRQAAEDEHAVVTALRSIYPGAAISTGPSKGGMTAIFHRRFYPDDVDATVAYVAPLSFAVPDARYAAALDTAGTPDCRAALRAAGVELLANRRAMLEARAADQAAARGHAYTRISLPAAVESSIVALEFLFWQYFGIEACPSIPAPDASDDAMWRFVEAVAPVSDSSDVQTAAFEAYAYQAYAELGFPSVGGAHLAAHLQFTDADYAGALPVGIPAPAYDGGAAMRDIDAFARTAPRLLLVYGEWDPWTAGAFAIDPAVSLRLTLPAGTHRTELADLPAADRAAAADRLAAWTGETVSFEPVAERRVPPALLRLRPRGVSSTHE